MSKKQNDENEAVEATEDKKEKKYRLDKLRGDCRNLYGVSSTTFAGATATLPDGEYTKAEIQTVLDEWRKKEAK